MGLEADTRYPATVTNATLIESDAKGTPGIQLMFDIDGTDEQIDHVLWLTPRTITRAAETLGMLGADREKLKSWTYLENLGSVLSGHECSITTIAEEYNHKTRIRVQWVNERKAPGANTGGRVVDRIASLFGGEVKPGKDTWSDDEVAF